MNDSGLRNTVIGFAVAAAFFVAVDGYLITETVPGLLAGALFGGLVGGGLVLLAWRRRAFDATSEAAEPAHRTNYMAVWVALFLMTIIEVGVAFLALSKTAIILALLLLAVWKALLVALYYMHLKYEPRRMWLLAATPLPLAMILVSAVLFEGW
jgi:cytochrome c oxidase subunit IV